MAKRGSSSTVYWASWISTSTPSAQLERRFVVRAPAVRSGAERPDRPVVGEVGDRAGAVAHPVPERAAALVRDLPGQHVETLDRRGGPRRSISNDQAPRSPSGPIGNAGGDMNRDTRSIAGAALGRDQHPRARHRVDRRPRKNGRPWVWSQCRWPSRIVPSNGSPSSRPVTARRPVPASSTSVGRRSSPRQTATHEVLPPTSAKSRPGAGRRAANAAEDELALGALLLAAMPRRQRVQSLDVDALDRRRRDLALGHGAQRGGAAAALQHGALAEHGAGPDLGQRLAVDLDRQHAVEQQVQLAVVGSALLDERVPLLDARGCPACWPPRMIASCSSRSSSVSTSVTSAGESSSPHGVRRPNESFIHALYSARLLLATSLPLVVEHPVAGEAGRARSSRPCACRRRGSSAAAWSTRSGRGTARTAGA